MPIILTIVIALLIYLAYTTHIDLIVMRGYHQKKTAEITRRDNTTRQIKVALVELLNEVRR